MWAPICDLGKEKEIKSMKIKHKVQKTLPQLIDYIWDNDIKDECFRRLKRGPFEYVWVNEDSNIEFDDYMLFRKNDIFEIEIEEVVDEDTVFNYLLLTYKKDNDKIETYRFEDNCIKSVLSQSSRSMYVSEQLSISYFDDKGIPYLIWTHEKGLVE